MSERLLAKLGTLFLLSVLPGCAYFTTYARTEDLRKHSLSIDVKQRIVLSQQRVQFDKLGNASKMTVVCAEPSPDALTVLGVSGGLSFTDGTRDQVANASAALSESGAFVGLRTQSIQLLRDAMYRLCEGYASGAVNAIDFAAMQRRYQSTMMGLIAIEQLTRPVVAAQALLTSSTSAQAGASAGDAAVDAAIGRLDAAVTKNLTAQAELDQVRTKSEVSRAAFDKANNDFKSASAAQPPDKDLLAKLDADRSRLRDEDVQAQLALRDKERIVRATEAAEKDAAQQVRAAQARVANAASGSGQLGETASAVSESNRALAVAVRGIVGDINDSYMKDTCLALLTELVRDPNLLVTGLPASRSPPETMARESTLNTLNISMGVCQRILEEAERERRARSVPPAQ